MHSSLWLSGLLLIGVGCSMGAAEQGPNWVCINQKAGWQARDSQGEFVFEDQMWMLGGWFDAKQPNPRDVWKSPDGKQWTCAVEVAPWEHSDLSVALVYKNRMWFMGGRKLPGAENSNKVWSSPDGAQWTLETDSPGWCPRVSPSFVVFKDRMWVMGGTENFYDDNDQTLKNDVWSSADGKEWKLETAARGLDQAHPRPGRRVRRQDLDHGRRALVPGHRPAERCLVLGGWRQLDAR